MGHAICQNDPHQLDMFVLDYMNLVDSIGTDKEKIDRFYKKHFFDIILPVVEVPGNDEPCYLKGQNLIRTAIHEFSQQILFIY